MFQLQRLCRASSAEGHDQRVMLLHSRLGYPSKTQATKATQPKEGFLMSGHGNHCCAHCHSVPLPLNALGLAASIALGLAASSPTA